MYTKLNIGYIYSNTKKEKEISFNYKIKKENEHRNINSCVHLITSMNKYTYSRPFETILFF